jgi:putative sterol carrier protein
MAVANAQELFNEKVPHALSEHPEKAKELGKVFQFKISGDGGGEWTVDLASPTPVCKPGLEGKPDCTIEIAHSDFMSLLSNPQMGMQLYFTGKLKVGGDAMLATKLGKIFNLG